MGILTLQGVRVLVELERNPASLARVSPPVPAIVTYHEFVVAQSAARTVDRGFGLLQLHDVLVLLLDASFLQHLYCVVWNRFVVSEP